MIVFAIAPSMTESPLRTESMRVETIRIDPLKWTQRKPDASGPCAVGKRRCATHPLMRFRCTLSSFSALPGCRPRGPLASRIHSAAGGMTESQNAL